VATNAGDYRRRTQYAGSVDLYKKFGFSVAGQLRSVGYKMGDWRDTLIMQRPLGDGDWTLPGDIRLRNRLAA
jgi:hypothetical protein